MSLFTMADLARSIVNHWNNDPTLKEVPICWGSPIGEEDTGVYAYFQQLPGGSTDDTSEPMYIEQFPVEIVVVCEGQKLSDAANDVAEKYSKAIANAFDWTNQDNGFVTIGSGGEIIECQRTAPILIAEDDTDEFIGTGIWGVTAEYMVTVSCTR